MKLIHHTIGTICLIMSMIMVLLGVSAMAIGIIEMILTSAEQHQPDKYLIHCRHQTSPTERVDVYHVVTSYWVADDGCLEARYHGEVLTDLCESCHVETQDKFNLWREQQYKDMFE